MTTLDGRPLSLRPDELATLRAACEMRDALDELQREHRRQGLIVVGSKGQPKLSGLPAEIRQHHTALARLLAQIDMPDESAGSKPMTYAQRHASAAGHARWRREDERRAATGQAPRRGRERRLDAADPGA